MISMSRLYRDYINPLFSWLYNNYMDEKSKQIEKLFNDLHQAAQDNDTASIISICEVLPACVNYQTLSGLTPLMIATKQNHADAVRVLIQHNADIYLSESTGYKTAMSFATSPTIKTMLSSKAIHNISYKYLPLHKAVAKSDLLKTKEALKIKNIDINGFDANGQTPLMIACLTSQLNMVSLLLENGANPALCDKSIITQSAYGAFEMSHDKAQIEQLLLEHAPCTTTPLHYAAFRGRRSQIDKLLASGEYLISMKDGRDETALFAAIRGQHKKTFQHLIKQGASLTQRSHEGYTVLGYAKYLKNQKEISSKFYQQIKSIIGLKKNVKLKIKTQLIKKIDKAILGATQAKKKILVLLGEIHFNSAIDQIRKIIYRHLSQKGIKRAYEEYPSTDYSHHKFEERVENTLKMLITPIDDGRQREKNNDDFELRNDIMTERLIKFSEPGVMTTGCHHLLGFHQRRKLANTYYILPINLASIIKDDDIDDDDLKYENFARDKTKNIQITEDGQCSQSKAPIKYWNT